MTGQRPAPAAAGGFGLLERAVGYALGSLHAVTPEALEADTPCGAWNLRALLCHLDDSLLALHEAATVGDVRLEPSGCAEGDPVAVVRHHARQLLEAWADEDRGHRVSIEGCPVSTDAVLAAGALEVAVHGWDIGKACGLRRPLPARLAVDLLALAPRVVTAGDRPRLFARPVPAATTADPGDLLVSYLGRHP